MAIADSPAACCPTAPVCSPHRPGRAPAEGPSAATSGKQPAKRLDQATAEWSHPTSRSLLIIGFGELVVLGVVGLVGASGWVFWVG